MEYKTARNSWENLETIDKAYEEGKIELNNYDEVLALIGYNITIGDGEHMKKIPIGISDFKTLIQENYYFIDKSLFIKEIIEDGAKVILIPRPRRFGKTLNMSMLRYFYEKTEEDRSELFKGLNILL